MKKFSLMLLTMVMAFFIIPNLTQAQVEIRIGIPLPPPIVISAPPVMVVLPDTDIYVAPDYPQDIYFYDGWWWRPWRGHWYRSLNYNSGWAYYNGVPGWYGRVYPHWRENYRNHMWAGQRWNYHPVPYGEVHKNWKSWQSNGYWRTPQNRGTIGSYHGGVETRREFRGFGSETKGPKGPVVTHPGPDLSKNKSAFGGMTRGSEVQKQSNRGSESRHSMSKKKKEKGGAFKSDEGKGKGDRSR
jgi:hypothetical protein